MTATGTPDPDNRIQISLNESDATTVQAEFFKEEANVLTTINVTTDLLGQGQPLEYIGIQKLGTTYHGWVATANGTWIYMGFTVWGGGTVDRLFFTVTNNDNSNPANKVTGFDFVRVLETGDRLP
jgi:hypothetical protein